MQIPFAPFRSLISNEGSCGGRGIILLKRPKLCVVVKRVRIFQREVLAKLGNFLRLDKYDVAVPEHRTGKLSDTQTIVNVFRGDAVAGLLHLTHLGKHYILLVEQFRLPTLIDPISGLPDLERANRDEHAGRLVELIAGTQEPDEPWLETFRRECLEETGLVVENVEFISSFYPSPGACSEQIHLYYGHIDWPDDQPLPGTTDEVSFGVDNEDIRRITLEIDEFLRQIESGEISDAKCFVAAEWIRRPGSPQKMGLE